MRSVLGATLLELTVVLAVLGLALTSVAVLTNTSVLADGARAAARTISRTRLLAIVDGRAAGVTPGQCSGGSSIGVELQSGLIGTWPHRGLLFTPDGLPRACDGGGVGNTTILLEHRGRQAAVIVSSLGRVRWELR